MPAVHQSDLRSRGWRDLFGSLALALLIAFVVGFALLGLRMEKSRTDLAKARIDLYLDELALQLENGLRFGVPLADIGAGERIAQSILSKDLNVKAVLLLNDKGEAVIRVGDAELMDVARHGGGAAHWVVQRRLRDVIAADAGEIRLVYDVTALNAELGALVWGLVSWIGLLFMAGMFVLALLSRWVVRRIEEILRDLENALEQTDQELSADLRLGVLGEAIVQLETLERNRNEGKVTA